MRHTILVYACATLANLPATAQTSPWNLQQCIAHALEHNINIKQQKNNVKTQEVALNTSLNSRLPDLSASAGESVNFGRGLTMNNTYANRNTQSTNFNLGTSLPVYTGGQLSNQIKLQKLNLQAALATLERAKESVSLQVASAYLEAICQKELVAVAERQRELTQVQVHRIETLLKNGKATEADLAEIRATIAADELALTQQKNAAMLAMLELTQLLELPSPDEFDILSPTIDNPADIALPLPQSVYDEAIAVKPQIQESILNVKSAERNVRIAQSGYYPTLHFSGGLGSSYYKTSGFEAASFGRQLNDNLSEYLGLSLSIPIFNRFSTRNSVRSARLQVTNQQLQLEDSKKSLYKEIQQSYYNALAAQKQCLSSDAALDRSRTSFLLTQKKFENGKANATEYQEQKTALLKAESAATQSRYTLFFRKKILDFYRGILF